MWQLLRSFSGGAVSSNQSLQQLALSRAKLIPRNDTLKQLREQSHDIKKPSRVPFTITYNPALPNINKIRQKKQPILNLTARLQKIYKETPVVPYRRSPNLRDLLVRANLRNPANTALNQPHGTFRCNSKHGCLTCSHIKDGRTTYTFSNTGEVREIKQHITCKSINLTYMIECHKCKKQYIYGRLNVHFANNKTHSSRAPTHEQCFSQKS